MATQPTAMQLAARANGRLGGLARAKKLSAEARTEIARKAGNKTRDNYGSDFYSHAASKRKRVGRNRTPVK